MPKHPSSYRLSEEARTLIVRLKERHGVSEADVIEMAVRRMARADLSEGGAPPATVLDMAVALVERGKRPG
jgi:hypothetical protein